MKCELLAPAGSYESALAAIHAGADAIYIGGTKFGARAYADNLTEEKMIELLRYAHLHQVRIYMTVNTLLKDSELDMLADYLRPYYLEGLDGVIVQDLGVIRMIRKWFPNMEVHASTQLTSNSAAWFEELEKLGVTRVVLSREMSLEEIRSIRKQTDLEIEGFIHGALCYSFSGQCLMSSLIGGRSGNRGRCAQPCRLPYEFSAGGKNYRRQYWMSLKDMETLKLLPQILEAGVFSLKIEGRMKRPEYTAGVVSVYRKYIDLYEKKGKKGYTVDEKDIDLLKDLYNRGGFCSGYYKEHNSKAMLSLERPNHQGTDAIRVESVKGQNGSGVALEELGYKDRLETFDGQLLSLVTSASKGKSKEKTKDSGKVERIPAGKRVTFTVERGAVLKKGDVILRTQNAALLQKLSEMITTEPKIEVSASCMIRTGVPSMLTVSAGGASVTVRGDIPEVSMNRPLTQEGLSKQLKKTGGFHFELKTLDIVLDDLLFLPLPSINRMRREALEQLEQKILSRYTRSEKEIVPDPETKAEPEKETVRPAIYCLCNTGKQAMAVAAIHDVEGIYLETSMFYREETDASLIRKLKAQGKRVYLALPHILREEFAARTDRIAFLLNEADGALVRNIESYAFLKKTAPELPFVIDTSLYTYNREAAAFWEEKGIERRTLSFECREKELIGLGGRSSELVIYGRIAAMLSAQCFWKTAGICRKDPETGYLKDRKGKRFPVQNICSFCYNVIYNCDILDLRRERTAMRKIAPAAVRFQFLEESAKEAADIVNGYLTGELEEKGQLFEGYTRGHFHRGVE